MAGGLGRRVGRLAGCWGRTGPAGAGREGFDPRRLTPEEGWELDRLLALVSPLPGEPAARAWSAAEAARAKALTAKARGAGGAPQR